MQLKQLVAQLNGLMKSQGGLVSELATLKSDFNALKLEHESLKLEHQVVLAREQQLRADYEALLASTQTLIADRDRVQRRVVELEASNAKLTNMLWGRRSERRYDDQEQPLLDGFAAQQFESLSAEEQAVIVAGAEAQRLTDEEIVRAYDLRRQAQKAVPRNEQLPAHLERREQVFDLSEPEKANLKYIGDAISERLRFEKPTMYVERTVRRKYVNPSDKSAGVIAIEPPPSMVEGSKYDASVHAAVVSMKFGLHMPTYREQEMFSMCGWAPSRSTLNVLINQSCEVALPLYRQLQACVLSDNIIQADDTTLTLLTRNSLNDEETAALAKRLANRRKSGRPASEDDAKQGSITSYAWCYCGLDDGQPYNVFQWSVSREHELVSKHLAGFTGTLVGDAFGGNANVSLRAQSEVQFAACNAHARREFVESEKHEPLLVSQALSLYRQLYDVEDRGRTLSAADRHALRQHEAVPIWQRFEIWLNQLPADRVLPKSRFGQAVTYFRNQWSALQVYLSDGRLPFDNGLSERTIRPLTIGRGNWLFLGHPRAALSRLAMFSIVSSARRHQLVMQDYLEDVFRSLSYAAQRSPAELELGSPLLRRLLPDEWSKANPKSVHTFRRDEQQDRQKIKQVKRAQRRLPAVASADQR